MEQQNTYTLFGKCDLLFKKYIRENSVVIGGDDNLEDLKPFGEFSKNYRVFLAGENHGVAYNEKLKVMLLKYLVKNANVKYFLIEAGYIDSIILNRYLNTGDIDILDNLFKSYRGYYSGSQECYNSWKEIYDFNQTLPKDKKIEVIGIDSPCDFQKALEYIDSILPQGKVIPLEIEYVIEGLKKVYNISFNKQEVEFDFYTFWITYMQSIKIHRGIYEGYFGKDFFDFYMMSKNLFTPIRRKMNTEKSKEIREKALYENFIDIYSRKSDGNFFGQFGSAHISNSYNIVESFASRLNNYVESPVNSKILRLIYLYHDCKTMLPHNNLDKHKTGTINLHIMLTELFSSCFLGELNLVRLNGNNTPFTNILMNRSEFLEEFTADNIQYCILINGSKACTPFE